MTNFNPFPYTDDNKRYHTWNYYLKHQFHQKIFKVALNAGFTCPNRDGTCGYGGCTFCSSLGSGDCAGDIHDDLQKQYAQGISMMQRKWPSGKPMAYFQAYTNTYASLSVLKTTFEPFFQKQDMPAISIATRADCLDDDIIQYLQTKTQEKEVWIELGLQSMHNQTALKINRGHTLAVFLDCIHRLKDTNLKICVHIMNSLPGESTDDMLKTAKLCASLPIHAVKIHMLHIIKDTKMAEQYQALSFPLLSKEAYIQLVIAQLEILPPEMIIQRLTGDGVQDQLIAPLWTIHKRQIINDIDKAMANQNTWQGRLYQKT